MGLSFNRLNYTIQDVFGESSYAEKMKKKYKGVVDTLEKNINSIGDIECTKQLLANNFEKCENICNLLSGEIRNVVTAVDESNQTEIDDIIKTMSTALSDMKKALETAREKYKYWCDEVSKEDKEMKTHDKKYYDSKKS